MNLKLIIAATIALVSLTGAANAQDAANGEKVFRKCKACHSADEEKNKVGPHLVGIIGRNAASVEGYKYGDGILAAAEKIGAWDEAKLAEYLADPSAYVGGKSKMNLKLSKENERKDVAAYLASLKK
jgi:cytochrome c